MELVWVFVPGREDSARIFVKTVEPVVRADPDSAFVIGQFCDEVAVQQRRMVLRVLEHLEFITVVAEKTVV